MAKQLPLLTRQRPPRRGVVLVLLLALAFGGGFAAGQTRAGASPLPQLASASERAAPPPGAPADLSKDVDFALFWQVWQTIQTDYLHKPVEEGTLFHGALAGLVASLDDPYSVYLEPKLAEEFAKDLEGTFEGIGAEIGIKGDQITVIAPLPDTPASKAGLRAGDKILTIDEVATVGMTVEEAVNRIRGEGGTTVHLLVLRTGAKAPQTIDITRAKIVVKSVRWEKKTTANGTTVAWIQIRQFNDETAALFDRAVRELMKENPIGIIVDLRNNPGGYLDAAVQVAGQWMNGAVVIERKADGSEEPQTIDGVTRLKGIPTVVLVNEGSASGSEILAGALQDEGAATIVGGKTFGKGSVQDYQELPDGGALKLTVAEWLTPKKRSINKEGISPDVEVKLTDEDANADKDPQLAKALEILETAGAR